MRKVISFVVQILLLNRKVYPDILYDNLTLIGYYWDFDEVNEQFSLLQIYIPHQTSLAHRLITSLISQKVQ